MSVCRQIRLVLWKNFTLRRRRWARIIFEIIWPLFLFLILMWVRTRNLVFYHDACHQDPKYLGSTGFLPALQTYICRWNSTCFNYSTSSVQFNNQLWENFADLTNSLSFILNDNQTVHYLADLFNEINSINTSLITWNGIISANKSINDFNQSIPISIINVLFLSPVNLTNLHQSWLINRTNSLSNLDVIREIYLASIESNFSYSYESESSIQQAFCLNGEMNRTFLIHSSQWFETKTFLCSNLSAIDLKDFLITVQEQFDNEFLNNTATDLIGMTSNGMNIIGTLENLQSRLNLFNMSFPFQGLNNNFNLTTLCGGRNDLSSYLESNPPDDDRSRSAQISPMDGARSSKDDNSSMLSLDWADLATDLLAINESSMCVQTYKIGSGYVEKVVSVNRSCRCVLFDRIFNSNDNLKTFSAILRPLVYGQIYYHPSNAFYDQLIQQLNQTFESLDELVKICRQIQTILRSNNNMTAFLCNLVDNSSIFCPNSQSYENFLTLFTIFTEYTACVEKNRFIPKTSESQMVSDGQNNSATDTFLAAIEFLDDIPDNTPVPKHIKYKIRMVLDYVDSTIRTQDRYFQYSPRFGTPGSTKYHTFGFIYLQNALDRAIIKAQTGVDVSYGIQTQQMPYPCWMFDQFVSSIRQMLPLFMVLSWIFTVSMNVKDIVYEKEKRLKEIMRIMGLNDSVHWLTWFVLCSVVMITIAIFLVLILKYGKITQYSNILILIIFFLCYTFATINQCFLISVFFNRANLAACGAGIIYFILYLPYTLLINYDTQALRWHKVIACFSSTVAFGVGCDYIARFEGMEQGIQWSNINKGAQPDDTFSFLLCLIMMLADSVIYMLLTLYIENVFPGEYGIPQPWYYPVTKTYWFGYDKKKIRERTQEINENEPEDNLSGVEVGVYIKNLSKYYRNKVALKNLSVKFYRNMITAFLGRNGAGKSTTWSILTGLIPPSSGTVYIDGYDILTDIKVVRKRLGFAPQHNILFDRLTVREHLEFFSALKDAPQESIEQETNKMLEDLTLVHKAENYSTELSGGMKRKLSIAIAFIGNSTTVILDEPTAGVDPFARRAIWDLILKYKPGRTIVLSTHHLDEADLLCDRLAIISSGVLQCVGTTMFLKRKYGEGYNLIIESTLNHSQIENKTNNEEVDLDQIELSSMNPRQNFQDLTDFLKTYMPDIKVKEQHGDQITYIILDDLEHTKIFPPMLADLDANKEKFAIKNYGLSNSSIEQVFLRVADEVKRVEDYERTSWWKTCLNRIKCCKTTELPIEENSTNNSNNEQEQSNECISAEWSSYADERYTGFAHLATQIFGLLIKRFHRTKRNIKGLIAEILLPIIFILLAMLVTKLAPNQNDPPPLILHPWYWGKPNYMFESISLNEVSNLSKFIQQTFTKSPSLGTRCMSTTMLHQNDYPCDSAQTGFFTETTSEYVLDALNQVNYSQTKISPQCDCYEKQQVCPIGAGGPAANYDVTETKDILYHMNGFNLTDWITKTEYSDTYLMKRFGGWEYFLHQNSTSFNLLNETLITQINKFFNSGNQSVLIDARKLLPLFEIAAPQVSIWYNNKGWPASVAFLNIFNNAILRGVLSQQNSSFSLDDYGITAINHPLPKTSVQLDSELQTRVAIEMFTAICVIFALAFIPASFLVFLIDERVTTSKHLQFVSGVKGYTYWWANFLWDLTNYCVSITCCIIIFLAFNIQAYVQGINFLCLIVLLFLYGFAIIPIMYPINYFFKTPSTGFVLVSCINIFIGLITTIATITLENLSTDQGLQNTNKVLKKFFLIFPHYCLGRGLFDMSKIYETNMLSLKYIQGYVPISPFQFDIVGRNLLCLAIEGVFFFFFALLVQYRFFIPDRRHVRKVKDILHAGIEDDDVAAERERIRLDPTNQSGDILRMIDLVKIYGWKFGKKFAAVKGTCAGVKTGECFGLLGINGSGKSTTFKMLTGEIPITDGNAFINNYSVIKQINSVHKNIGYCPQFDALDSLLTAREHLYLYARLRGIRRKHIPFITDCLLKRLGLTLWADRPVKQYSGGNKRKLSTAISLIGNPSIIFMDEPTTGMDVRAKRFLWNCILTLTRKDHKSVVITSHSMEECETLCNRLVIMVGGEFKCFGSVQHLKTKFGDGYTIVIRINADSDSKPVIDYVKIHLPEANIKEEHNKMIHFRVSTNVPLYQMFRVLENAREELGNTIEDYTVTQVTLDDVFVNFAKIQEENSNEITVKDPWWKRNVLYKLFSRKKNNIVELTKL